MLIRNEFLCTPNSRNIALSYLTLQSPKMVKGVSNRKIKKSEEEYDLN